MASGGYGFTAYGRNQYGNARSTVEPRFSESLPPDNLRNVPTNQILKFEVYCFSSYIDLNNIVIEISENGGSSFVVAYDGSSFLAPFSGRLQRPDGQRIWIYIVNAVLWPIQEEIIVRFSGYDEFDQEATKEIPVKWE
jgi:hypothetical protein